MREMKGVWGILSCVEPRGYPGRFAMTTTSTDTRPTDGDLGPVAKRDWVALSLVRGLGPRLTARCLELMGSPRRVLEASSAELARVEGIGPARADAMRRDIQKNAGEGAIDRELDLIAEMGVELIALDDSRYPRLLRLIPDPPPVLYVRGTIEEQDAVSVGVVGSRRCSHYGREQADRFASVLAQSGLCIVSGGAMGIDTAAHVAALRAGGRTIAVIGSGHAKPYPPSNKALYDRLAESGQGAVVSELPMTAPPLAENFPARNRIISGLSLGVLVIEAAVRSGALITARLASEDHNREVMAIPGRIDTPHALGSLKILREGWAGMVIQPGDVLDALGEAGQLLKAQMPGENPSPKATLFDQNLGQTQKRLLELLEEPRTLDQLALASGLTVAQVQSDLTILQVRSLVAKQGTAWSRRLSGKS
ncbi:MAG: DNA-protecting protein DprA [Phycisphaera sp.]|nr:DNA-protecting protein DprA [Phycisphaera sp.]